MEELNTLLTSADNPTPSFILGSKLMTNHKDKAFPTPMEDIDRIKIPGHHLVRISNSVGIFLKNPGQVKTKPGLALGPAGTGVRDGLHFIYANGIGKKELKNMASCFNF